MLAVSLVESLVKNNIDVTLCMVGPEKDGTLAKCKLLAKQKDLPITFTGKLEKHKWIELAKNYDIFINTTNFDNTPISVIEAMALGLPIISTNVGGLPFLIEDKKTGILVEPNNENEFLKAINELVAKPNLVESLSLNARKKAESFDWEKVKHKWFAIINE
jgi:glycosyltransferase involved in cell wall biosynthesis